MIYREMCGKELSLLGFGTMRLPTNPDGSIDVPQVEAMTDYAIAHGVNYFDTAYPYHNGESERVIGRILQKYPRDSYYLANKYPGHQITSTYDPAAIFEEQLAKCGVDYFDFYLLHNVYENSMDVYLDPRWGIIDYFKEQRRIGRIKHLGFSTHARVDTLKKFLDICGDDMEFCQIQLNWVDWTLQDAKTKHTMLTERNIPIVVMEPLRGGKLAKPGESAERQLKEKCPEDSITSWSFRYLMGFPNVKVVLSGMSALEHMKGNIETFDTCSEVTAQETAFLLELAEELKDSIPCTACRYCCDSCPQGLDIPLLLSIFNDIRFTPNFISIMGLEAMPDDKQPSACIGCGQCSRMCPQGIDIPQAMKDFVAKLNTMPKWSVICREREAIAKAAREQK